MPTPAIQAHHLTVCFHSKSILKDINIELHHGEVTALLGPNGAGKSTLLKALSGEIDTHAKIRFFGQTRANWSAKRLAKHVGVLPQSSSLNFPFTAQEVVELGAIPLDISHQQTRQLAQYYMQKTDVLPLANRLYPELSGGEKQRLHLARVLTQLHQSGAQKVLMLDEPTSALDLAHQHKTLLIARQLAREEQCAVVIVLHDLNLAAQYADRMVMLHQGHIVCDAPPWQALSAEMIMQVYGHDSMIAPHPTLGFPMVYPV